MTRRLWARFDIDTRLTAYHAQSGPARERELLEHLAAGKRPGPRHGRRHAAGQRPGQRARLGVGGARRAGRAHSRCIGGSRRARCQRTARGAVVVRGVPAAARQGARRLIERIASDERTTILFEAPGRAAATLAELAARCGAERRAALCRELTKLHEEIWRGSLGEPRCACHGKRAARRGDHRRQRSVSGAVGRTHGIRAGGGSGAGRPARGGGLEPFVGRPRGRPAHRSSAPRAVPHLDSGQAVTRRER